MGSLDDQGRAHGVRRVGVHRIAGSGAPEPTNDVVATEEPLEIRIGYSRRDGSRAEENVAITMRTPGHDEDLAIGFLFTEGLIRSGADVEGIVLRGQPAADGLTNALRVELAPHVTVDFKKLERHFYTTSSCGICGKASIDAVAQQGQFDVAAMPLRVAREVLGRVPAALKIKQAVFEQTGGIHASGLFDVVGNVVALREDVGRHNALDKLIGHALMRGHVPLGEWGIVVSGRTSFELMQKAKMAGCPLVAAVGAPSSLAIELANEFGITLVGFLKPDRFNVYSRADRIA